MKNTINQWLHFAYPLIVVGVCYTLVKFLAFFALPRAMNCIIGFFLIGAILYFWRKIYLR